MNTLSLQRPRPSIEIATPASASAPVKAAEVNCEPWSVLKIPAGRTSPEPPRAPLGKTAFPSCSTAATSTVRDAQSMITTRWRKPRPIGL